MTAPIATALPDAVPLAGAVPQTSAPPMNSAAPVEAPGSLAEVLARLDAALDAAAGLDLGALTGAELAAGTTALRTIGARLDGFDARLLARFSSSGHWAEEGSRSVRSWLRERTAAGDREISTRTSTARWIDAYPDLGARLVTGEVSVDHLRVLADAHAQHRVLSRVLAAAEPVIADYAVGRTPGELRSFLAELMLRAAPDLVDEAEGRKLKDRARCDVQPLLDGWVRVVALLPPDLGARFLACLRAAGLDPAGSAAPDAAPAAGAPGDHEPPDSSPAGGSSSDRASAGGSSSDRASAGGSAPRDPGLVCDPRPIGARNLDALARLLGLAEAGLGADRLPALRGSRPVVTVLVDQQTLIARRRKSGVDPAALGGPANAITTPVSGEVARRIACDAAVRRLVYDPASQVIDVGRLTRVISAPLRAAIHFRDGGRCRWPGCRSPIDEVHHIVHWAHGGETTRRNTIGLCWWHHHLLHDEAWRLEGDGDGTVRFHDPGSSVRTPLTSRPAERPRALRRHDADASGPPADPIF